MEVVEFAPRSIDAYSESAGVEVVTDLRRLAAPPKGLRVLHVNATPHGGGGRDLAVDGSPPARPWARG